jgi:hypothetical protein
MNRLVLAALAALALTASPARAAQPVGRDSGNQFSVFGIASYYWHGGGVGLGARYELPIIPEGLLRAQVRDDVALDFGADFIHVSWGDVYNWDPYTGYYWTDLSFNALIPTVGVLWNFHITPRLTVYPKLDVGYAIMWWSSDIYGGEPHASALFVQGVAGATLKLDRLSLRGELGSGMLKLGISIPL